MAIALRQSAYAGTGESVRTAKATFSAPTVAGSLLLAIVAAVSDSSSSISGPSGWSQADKTNQGELTVALYYRANAPATTSVSVTNSTGRSIQLRALEYVGVRTSSPLDKIVSGDGTSKTIASGSTGTTSQADELIIGVVANRYTTSQSGFTGSFAQLFNSTSPADHEEFDRTRLSVHSRTTTATGSFSIGASLSTSRDWVALVATFKGGTSGPARFTSTGTSDPAITVSGRAALTAFGPLRHTGTDDAPMAAVAATSAWVGPFEYQYRLGGTSGLLIGTGTDIRVEAIDGLEGWEMRTSDADLPRGDGAQRGVDLQSPRLVQFTVNVDGPRSTIEAYLAELYTALRPQRDEDWQLYFRHPGRPLRYIWCRPTQLIREMDIRQVLLARQSFTLRAADPRHYGAVLKASGAIPVLPAGATIASVLSCQNAGNARAYPVIRLRNDDTVDLTALSLVNASADVRFEYTGTIPPGSELIADMGARIRATGEPVITLDRQSKYAGWDFPRDPFYLAPDPDVTEGSNGLYLSTTPAGADVACSVEWRDTFSG